MAGLILFFAYFFIILIIPFIAREVYKATCGYYRNDHQSHRFEYETQKKSKQSRRFDKKVHEIKGTKNKKVPGENSAKFRLRVERVSKKS